MVNLWFPIRNFDAFNLFQTSSHPMTSPGYHKGKRSAGFSFIGMWVARKFMIVLYSTKVSRCFSGLLSQHPLCGRPSIKRSTFQQKLVSTHPIFSAVNWQLLVISWKWKNQWTTYFFYEEFLTFSPTCYGVNMLRVSEKNGSKSRCGNCQQHMGHQK
jgi:hypothetical protein